MKVKKINIIGPSASGKTTLALMISKKTKLKNTSTDSFLLKRNKNGKLYKATHDEMEYHIDKVLKKKSWIIEGKYLSYKIINDADLIIWIHKKLRVNLVDQWDRYLKKDRKNKDYGIRTNLILSFNIIRQNLGLFHETVWENPRVYTYKKVSDMTNSHKKVVKIRSRKEANEILRQLEAFEKIG